MCNCKNVDFGTYRVSIPVISPFSKKVVDIDACILTEVAWLWKLGIETVNSCCGHNKTSGFIASPNHIEEMLELGYVIDSNTEASGCFISRGEWFYNSEKSKGVSDVVESTDALHNVTNGSAHGEGAKPDAETAVKLPLPTIAEAEKVINHFQQWCYERRDRSEAFAISINYSGAWINHLKDS